MLIVLPTHRASALVSEYHINDVRRRSSFPVWRNAWSSTVNEPSERPSSKIDEPGRRGRLGNDGGTRAVEGGVET